MTKIINKCKIMIDYTMKNKETVEAIFMIIAGVFFLIELYIAMFYIVPYL